MMRKDRKHNGVAGRAGGRAATTAICVLPLMLCGMGHAYAQSEPPAHGARAAKKADSFAAATPSSPRFAVFGQATYTEQESDGFHDPYDGPNSLTPNAGHETTDATLFLGARLWRGAELWVNPEVDEGSGLDNTLGLAGFSSGEAYKVGRNAPYLRLQRAFVRQTINLGGEISAAAAGPDQLAMQRSADRLVITVGKVSVVDIFDVNQYAHDPRADFLNWSVVDTGTFDYAADAWGYTVGGAAEWYVGPWAWRAGLFDLSDVPNSARLDPGFHEYQVDLEGERRYEIGGRPGKIDLTLFESHGRMALLQDAIAYGEAHGIGPDLAAVRRYRKRDGVSLNLEQQLTPHVGLFARLGAAGGNVETYEFTDIDRTAAVGVSVNGGRWRRPGDTLGLAGVINAASRDRRRFLAAGGLGILVGDGRLPHAGDEHILETYYEAAVVSAVHVTLDYQWVENPAYNRDRGPVSIFALRVHVEL